MFNFRNEATHWHFLLKQGGISKLWEHLRENIVFDLKHGTNTSSWLRRVNFELEHPSLKHGVRYRPSLTSEIRKALGQLESYCDPATTSFYDIGSGKGKVLLLADAFRNKTGVEYYPEFIRIAEKNFKAAGVSATIVAGDAADFTGYDGNSAIYLYNPFDRFMVTKVKSNIEGVVEKAVLAYVKPLHADVFVNDNNWRTLHTSEHEDPDRQLIVLGYGS